MTVRIHVHQRSPPHWKKKGKKNCSKIVADERGLHETKN